MEIRDLNLQKHLGSKRSSLLRQPVWQSLRPLWNHWTTVFAHVRLGVSSPASMSRLGTAPDRPTQAA
jgi:hypothetical protein